jgi:hypothetical protein
MIEFSLPDLISAHGGITLRALKVPNYGEKELRPSRTKRTEWLYTTADGAFISRGARSTV